MTQLKQRCIPWGWLTPEGEAIRCDYLMHEEIAKSKNCTQNDLEQAGWAKVTEGPAIKRTGTFFLKTYTVAYFVKAPTRPQERWLSAHGFFYVDKDTAGIKRFAREPD